MIPFLLVIHRAPNANINTLLTLTELKSIVDNILKLPITLPTSKKVKVTNTLTNEILYFDSLGKAAIHFNKPPSSLSRPVNLNTLYLKKYKIEYVLSPSIIKSEYRKKELENKNYYTYFFFK